MHQRLAIAAASADITPRKKLPLAGFSSRTGAYAEVADPLEINVLVLRRGDAAALLLTADLLYVTEALRLAVAEAVAPYGIEADAVFAAASHTHFAPLIDPDKGRLGEYCAEYDGFVRETACALAADLAARAPEPVDLRYCAAPAHHGVNRRSPARLGRGVRMLPNPGGPRDDTVRVVAFDGPDAPRCLLWNFACHPVLAASREAVSASYPGAVRAALRRALGAELPVLFLQGFCADVNPNLGERPRSALRRLARLVARPRFGQPDPGALDEWERSLGAIVLDAAAPGRGRAVEPELGSCAVDLPLDAVMDDAPDGARLTAGCLRLGRDLAVAGFSAEVGAGYAAMLQESFGACEVLPTGLLGGVHGYLPTERMRREGGYEAEGFLPYFGLRGGYRAGFSDRVGELMRAMAGRTACAGTTEGTHVRA